MNTCRARLLCVPGGVVIWRLGMVECSLGYGCVIMWVYRYATVHWTSSGLDGRGARPLSHLVRPTLVDQ